VYEHPGKLRHVPPLLVLVTAALASLGVVIATAGRGWPLWVVTLVALVPWIPSFLTGARWNYRRHHWLVLFYVLVVTQTAHFLEHVAQMVQLHLLNLTGTAARGVFGQLDIEWVHWLWNLWVFVAAAVLLVRFRSNRWLWFTALFGLWHGLEHTYILWIYLTTGVAGTPGWLAQGGAVRGGLPLQRPDLHFIYNFIETVPLLIAFVWQLRQPMAATPSQRPSPRAWIPAAVGPACVVALLGTGVAASFSDPVKQLLTPDGEVECDTFHGLVQDVRAQAIPVPQIRTTLDKMQAHTARADYNLRPALASFIRAAREAVASYYTYPTFDALAYSDTYAHMEAHVHTYETIEALARACVLAGYPAKERAAPTNGAVTLPAIARDQPPVQSDLLVRDPQQAVAAVRQYLADKPWGFFGATCGAWASMHYNANRADVGFSAKADEWIVDIPRTADALGPTVIRYHVDARSGLTHGDAAHNLNSDFAEGCDKY
jgi:hypothetical protein